MKTYSGAGVPGQPATLVITNPQVGAVFPSPFSLRSAIIFPFPFFAARLLVIALCFLSLWSPTPTCAQCVEHVLKGNFSNYVKGRRFHEVA